VVHFRIDAHIGSGGFGTVDEATRVDEDGNTLEAGLARKMLLPRWASNDEALARFKREVRILDEMTHPNILPVVGRNLSADPPWFVMPRAETSLAAEIAAGQHGDREWVVKRFTGVLSGMAYAHSQRRVLHRDLKPENVLIVGGIPKVSDFGLGKRLDPNTADLTSANIGMGTLAYMAPEQFTDAAHVGPAADVYSLGKMLGEMLTGRRPLVGRARLADFPEEFQSFIDHCTQDEAADRYANADDALAAFQLLVSGGGATGSLTAGELEDQIKLWETTPEGQDAAVVASIARLLVARSDDEELHFRAVPRLPRRLVTQLISLQPDEFDTILRAYNAHTQGALPFEYCDVLANFYRQVFRSTPVVDQQKLVLSRLLELGASHNRWHVGDIVAHLLAELGADTPAAAMASDVIRADPFHARWFKPYVVNRDLPPAVRSAFASLDPQPDDEPF
jgi:hypothetical protein